MTMTVPGHAATATAMPSLHLSRLLLNPRSRAVRIDLSDCNALHRTILRAFPAVPATAASTADAREYFEILYRVDADRRAHLALLVQSAAPPNWSHLSPDYLEPSTAERPNPTCKRVDDLYGNLTGGQTLLFRLRANPTKKVDTRSGPNGERRNGRRVALRGEAEQQEWLRRKGRQHGFEVLATTSKPDVLDVRATEPGHVTGLRRAPGSGEEGAQQRLTFGSVLFEGRLRIADVDALRDALVRGIGSGKAYGFGLLSIAPPRG